jgi:glycosyltransferase involved in cell wall biosynthesis
LLTQFKPVPVLHAITRLIVGGAQENTLFTAELLDPDCFRVDVVTGPQTGSEGNLINEAINRGINIVVMPELVRQVNPIYDFTALTCLTKMITRKQYAIVHTHSSKAGILGRIAAYHAKTPIIIHTVHGWSFHPYMNPALRFLYILLEKYCASFTDALIFVSKRDMDIAKTEKIGLVKHHHLIRSAIPMESFNPSLFNKVTIRKELGIPIDAPVLGNVGRFSLQKDPLRWVKVAALVLKQIPECWFLLIGDGPLRRQCEKEMAQNDLINRTVFLGIRRDVARYFLAMDVFLITSSWEGLPRVIPQAMAMKVPVVANHVPGIDEVVLHGKTGYVANKGDDDALASYCSFLLSNENLRVTIAQKAREFIIDQFDLKAMIAGITDLYKDLVEKKRPGN